MKPKTEGDSRFSWHHPDEIRIVDPTAPPQVAPEPPPLKRKPGRPKGTKVGHRRQLTPAEWQRLISAARQGAQEEYAFIALVYSLALRVSEAVSILWSAVDLRAGTISIQGLKDGTFGVSPIPPKVRKVLFNLHHENAKRPMPSDFVFPARRATAFTDHLAAHTAKCLFKRLCRKAGITSPHSIHDLRHSRAQALADEGQPNTVISATLRHKSLKTANQYLVPSISPTQAKAISRSLNRQL